MFRTSVVDPAEVFALLAAQHFSNSLSTLGTGTSIMGQAGADLPAPLAALSRALPGVLEDHPGLLPRLLQAAVGVAAVSTVRVACSDLPVGQAVKVQPRVCVSTGACVHAGAGRVFARYACFGGFLLQVCGLRVGTRLARTPLWHPLDCT